MMSELLRLANELMTLERDRQGGWPCHGEYPCMYTDDVTTVIKGYQDLVRRMITDMSACATHVKTNDDLLIRVVSTLTKARESIPQEQSNE